MSKIQVARYSSLLRRFLSLAGVEFVTEELAPEISGVMVLENDRPDWHFLKNERLMSFVGSIGPSGAFAGPTARLRNPTGSGIIAQLGRSYWSAGAGRSTCRISLNALNTDLANPLSGNPLDTRQIAISSAMVCSSTSVLGPVATGSVWLGAIGDPAVPEFNNAVPVDVPIVLTPGHVADFGIDSVTDRTLFFSIYWVERALAPLEA